jgi:hypothetical protein
MAAATGQAHLCTPAVLPTRNVGLPPGAVAQLWAGQRGGHFRTLSASASFAWAPAAAPPARAAPGDAAGDAAAAPPAAATATAIEQFASVGMAAPRTLAGPPAQAQAAAKMVPILNFTAPPNFNPEANQVVMWLSGQWAANRSSGAAVPTGGAASATAPVGGVALMRHGQVLAYTFPSDEAKAQGGTFFYGAVWKNIGLPADGGVIEVWAGAQGGAFKGLKVNITLKWTPGDGDVVVDPAATQPVEGNPLAGDGPLAVPQPPPPPQPPAPPAPPTALPPPPPASGGGAMAAPPPPPAAASPPPKKACKLKLRPWAQCGEPRARGFEGVPGPLLLHAGSQEMHSAAAALPEGRGCLPAHPCTCLPHRPTPRAQAAPPASAPSMTAPAGTRPSPRPAARRASAAAAAAASTGSACRRTGRSCEQPTPFRSDSSSRTPAARFRQSLPPPQRASLKTRAPQGARPPSSWLPPIP